MSKLMDLTGQVFGTLTVLRLQDNVIGRKRWLCRCSCCNKEVLKTSSNLRNGRTKSCGKWRQGLPGKRQRLADGEAAFNALYGSYKIRAKEDNVIFDITKEEFRVLTKCYCHYCGEEPTGIKQVNDFNGQYLFNGLDKKNPLAGYTLDNVVPCCKKCNHMKYDLPYADFINRIRQVARHLQL